jgi:hypothetical protein
MTNLLPRVLAAFPPHKCSLTLTHNEHRDVYQSVADWIAENEMYEWRTDDDQKCAIDQDSIWTLQWYPHTPIGFLAIAASSLENLLIWAREVASD